MSDLPPPPVTHNEFSAAYREGRVKVDIDPVAARRFLAARLLLPLFMLPILGGGVALALLGHVWAGLAVIACGLLARTLIKRSAPHFVLTQMLADEKFYNDISRAGVVRLTPTGADT